MYGYIYMTTNKLNNMRYIGRRKSDIFLGSKYLGSGVHLTRAVKKYGKENFTVSLLEECNFADELIERETFYIKKFDAVNSDKFYNQSYGGPNEGFIKGGLNIAKTEHARKLNSEKHKGKKMPEEFCKHQSEIHKGKPSGMLGHKHSDKTKLHLSNKTKYNNLNRDSSIYLKISKSAKGNKMMHKDNICKRIHPEDFDRYLADGWSFGGLPRNIDRSGPNNPMYGKSKNNKDTKWIHKNNQKKYVSIESLDAYFKDGWKLGMK